MRIVAGKFKGRPLQAVPGMNTRPTTDKVKESLFSMIGPFFQGGICLDLYAGTGSLGIEAISRGIDKGIFIDVDRKAIEVIGSNIKSLKIEEKVEVYKNDAERALNALAKREMAFDLVFLDPPYAKEKNQIILEKLVNGNLLKPDAIVVAEHDRNRAIASPSENLTLWKANEYGDTSISIFKYINQ